MHQIRVSTGTSRPGSTDIQGAAVNEGLAVALSSRSDLTGVWRGKTLAPDRISDVIFYPTIFEPPFGVWYYGVYT